MRHAKNTHLPFVFFVSFVVQTAFTAPGKASSPLSPERAADSIQLADESLTIELVAAEPDVVSPVAVAWDADGRMFVAEMRDYPIGPAEGTIRLLEDRDRDGTYERSTIFAEGLAFPNGVLPVNGGVLVTAAPDILFLKDTDGDGKADHREVVLTGFAEGNQQLRVNGLHWGIDNWIYGANGRSDGDIRRPGDPPDAAVSIRRRDFRFRLGGPVEAVAGFSQFGLARDDWGNRFPSWNTVPMRHVVLEERFLSRNPHLAAAGGVAAILDPADVGRVYGISEPATRYNRESVEYFNASCGLAIFRGDGLGPAYAGNPFVCEPLINLVHRRVLERAGPTFVARRVEPDREFLASTDPWFHPVNIATGPDGCLYICDFYRELVEHPQFVPEGVRDTIDFAVGREHGRIWRIRRKDHEVGGAPRLSEATIDELAVMLTDDNGWRRDTAQRLLIERQAVDAAGRLERLVQAAEAGQTRVQAMWTLDGLGRPPIEVVGLAMNDVSAPVREASLDLLLSHSPVPRNLAEAVRRLAGDADPVVRFKAALVLSEWSADESLAELAAIAARDGESEWTRLAILSGLNESADAFLQHLLATDAAWLADPSPGRTQFLRELGSVIGSRNEPSELVASLDLVMEELHPSGINHGRLAFLAGLVEGLDRAGRDPAELIAKPPVGWDERIGRIASLLEAARSTALDVEVESARRATAVELLAKTKSEGAGAVCLKLLAPGEPTALQTVAARGIVELGDAELAGEMTAGWATYGTATRREIVAAMLSSPTMAGLLVDALDESTIAPNELDPATWEALARLADPALAERVARLAADAAPVDRGEALERYAAAAAQSGDPVRGGELFAKHCQACHVFQGRGNRVGPDLSGVGSRAKEVLLVDLLDPGRVVPPDYMSFLAITTDGRILSGLLTAETAGSIRLRRAEGAEDTILRTELAEFRVAGKSLMPEGFEQHLSVDDVADLLEFLRQQSPTTAAP